MSTATGNRFRNIACSVVFLSGILSWPASAQWLDYPTPGIPRTPDGKPNLAAPAPRTADGKPDLSGLWRVPQATSGETNKALQSLKAQPWAEELSKKRKEDLGREDMSVLCLPFGPRAALDVGKIIQTPGILMMAFEDLRYRQIFLDGRPLPKDPNPTWMGYSVGHWDGETLVIRARVSTTRLGWTVMAILIRRRCVVRNACGGPILAVW